MITIFATPKNFEGIFNTIQNNALNSWRALSDEIENNNHINQRFTVGY